MIIMSAFREGSNTPINLAIVDNRIKNREKTTFCIFRGNLKYQKLIFNLTEHFP